MRNSIAYLFVIAAADMVAGPLPQPAAAPPSPAAVDVQLPRSMGMAKDQHVEPKPVFAGASSPSHDVPQPIRGEAAPPPTKVGAPSAAATPPKSNVKLTELTDATFDHDTQLGTHGTTGPWFIKFYAPWCGHCRRMEPAWQELAGELEGEVSVGSVDATKNRGLAERFEVQGYPTLLYFKEGKMYRHSGPRTATALAEFARSGHKEQPGAAIPRPLTQMDILRKQFLTFLSDMVDIINGKPIAGLAYTVIGISIGLPIGACVAIAIQKRHSQSRLTQHKKKA